jgi:hypothetical protein
MGENETLREAIDLIAMAAGGGCVLPTRVYGRAWC